MDDLLGHHAPLEVAHVAGLTQALDRRLVGGPAGGHEEQINAL